MDVEKPGQNIVSLRSHRCPAAEPEVCAAAAVERELELRVCGTEVAFAAMDRAKLQVRKRRDAVKTPVREHGTKLVGLRGDIGSVERSAPGAEVKRPAKPVVHIFADWPRAAVHMKRWGASHIPLKV